MCMKLNLNRQLLAVAYLILLSFFPSDGLYSIHIMFSLIDLSWLFFFQKEICQVKRFQMKTVVTLSFFRHLDYNI